ncbi:MAG: ATP-binding protein [Ardenticatenaceae bacterium]|nr:ATP-binding protein [Ardenticatenaceae bacterium]
MNANDRIILSLPARHLYLSMAGAAVAALIKQLGEADHVLYDIQIALQEICANVIDHAYENHPAGTLVIEIYIANSSLVIYVIDEGEAFEPQMIKEPILGELHEGGYGLFFAKSLMDEVHYERRDHQNHWTLRKSLSLSFESHRPFD